MRALLVVTVLIALGGCVAQPPLVKQTASGRPEGIFVGFTLDQARSRVIEACSTRGLSVYDSNANSVVCGKALTGQKAVLAQMLVGNSYSTTPEDKIRFILFQSGSDVKINAEEWIETQMALGQVRREPLSNNNQQNGLQEFLFAIGAR